MPYGMSTAALAWEWLASGQITVMQIKFCFLSATAETACNHSDVSRLGS